MTLTNNPEPKHECSESCPSSHLVKICSVDNGWAAGELGERIEKMGDWIVRMANAARRRDFEQCFELAETVPGYWG